MKTVIKIIISYILFQTYLFADKGDFEKISLQLQWKHQFQFAGYYIAKEKGFYKELGLKVKIKEFGHWINTADEVSQNRATYGIGRSSLIIDKANGKNIKLLSAIFQSSPSILLTTQSSGIKTIKDFIGKKIMVTSDIVDTVSIQAMAKQKKVNIDDMLIQQHSFNIDDLISGKTDLMASYISNEPYLLEERGVKYTIFDPKDYDFDFYSDILFTSDNEVQNHKQRVNRFNNASIKGWEYAFSNIEETVDLILKKYNTQNKSKKALIFEANELKKLAYYKTEKLGNIKIHKIQRIYDIYNVMGLIKNKTEIDDIIFKNQKTNLQLTFDESAYIKKNKIIKMCNNQNAEPLEFAFNNNQNDMRGITIDTLKLIEEQLDIKFVNVPTKNWEESQQFLKEKRCDILPAAIKNSKRLKYANFTKPYLKFPLAILTHKNKGFIANFEYIIDKKMVIRKGSGLIKIIQEKYPPLDIIQTKSHRDTFQYLLNGKADFTIAMIPIASRVMSKYLMKNIHIAGYTDMIYKLSIAVRDDNILLLNILDKSLNQISKKQHNKIYKKWVTPVVKEKVVDYHLVWEMVIAFSLILVVILFFYLKQLKLKNYINKQKELFEAIFKGSKDAIAILDMRSNFLEVNPAYEDMTGFTKQELLKTSCLALTSKKDIEPSKKAMKDVLNLGYIRNFEKDCIVKGGTTLTINMSMSLLHNPNRVLISVRDISELKRKDKLISEQSKMVALGEMIGNIAHQWRQPLSVIATLATGMQMQKEYGMLTDEKFEKNCTNINEQAQFLSKTINDFKNYIKGDSKKVKFNLKNDSDSFLKLVDSTIKSDNLNVILQLDEHISIKGYPNHLIQCFINIFNNAKDALVENNSEDNRYIFIIQKVIKNNVVIKFRDNAGGIPEDVIPKIFEPYFTTKHQSIGTGLGLHMTYNLINSMNGEIDVQNVEYKCDHKIFKGAEFTITIPIS